MKPKSSHNTASIMTIARALQAAIFRIMSVALALAVIGFVTIVNG
jgi:hypothetical protein